MRPSQNILLSRSVLWQEVYRQMLVGALVGKLYIYEVKLILPLSNC
jgi:hypothetical protein